MKRRVIFRVLLAAFFVAAGVNHFRLPEIYLGMMPPWLPSPLVLVQVSGAAEILGGVGVLIPFARRCAGWGLLVLLVAVFPANLHVALQGRMIGFDFSPMTLWLRLPVQVILLVWVWWVAVVPDREETLD